MLAATILLDLEKVISPYYLLFKYNTFTSDQWANLPMSLCKISASEISDMHLKIFKSPAKNSTSQSLMASFKSLTNK